MYVLSYEVCSSNQFDLKTSLTIPASTRSTIFCWLLKTLYGIRSLHKKHLQQPNSRCGCSSGGQVASAGTAISTTNGRVEDGLRNAGMLTLTTVDVTQDDMQANYGYSRQGKEEEAEQNESWVLSHGGLDEQPQDEEKLDFSYTSIFHFQ